jgi:predicted nucleotidyltransferase component of viral defense system
VRLDPARLAETAETTGFPPQTIEKVVRLQRLLDDIFAHPYLTSRLVLKGGTALHMFYFELPRLSVDIDLNYVGSAPREAMLEERPEVERLLTQIMSAHGYRIQQARETHAGRKFYLSYTAAAQRPDRVEVDVNYLQRVSFLPHHRRTSVALPGHKPCAAEVLSFEEVVAGKASALLDRAVPRDLFDLFWLARTAQPWDRATCRRLMIVFAATSIHDPRDLSPAAAIDRFREVDFTTLHQVIRQADRPSLAEMAVAVAPLLVEFLTFNESERAFLDALAEGELKPELLFPDRSDLAEKAARHPGLQWKTLNVRQFRERQRRERNP